MNATVPQLCERGDEFHWDQLVVSHAELYSLHYPVILFSEVLHARDVQFHYVAIYIYLYIYIYIYIHMMCYETLTVCIQMNYDKKYSICKAKYYS